MKSGVRAVALVTLLAATTTTTDAFGPSFQSSSFTRQLAVASTSPAQPKQQHGKSMQLNMMFDQLSAALSEVAKNFGPKARMTEANIKPALREVRRALLDADVNIDVADALIDGVKKRSLGEEVIKGVTADQQFIKAMYDELLDMMGGDSSIQKPGGAGDGAPAATLATGTVEEPAVVLLAGLQGAGKTTAAGKLALYLKEREVDYSMADFESDEPVLANKLPKRERKVLLAAADVYRPAAIKQLEILGESIGVEVFSLGTEADPVDIAAQALQKAKDEGYDTVLIDTAGRQVIDNDLMDELKRIKAKVNPTETLLVVDAMTGQEAASLTASFDSAVGITGAVLTKMDGDSRGGAAVSVRGVSGKPIKFVGVGEKVADLEPFYPDRMASRILGMGDVISLVEKAAAEVSDEEARLMSEKMMKAEFDFDDFMKQAKLVSNMGNLASVAKMMPGMGGKIDQNQIRAAEVRLKKNEAMINSMTKAERRNPELLINHPTSRSRQKRIALGSGMKPADAQAFMSEFQKMRTMMSRMSKMAGMGDQMEPAMAEDPEAAMMGAGNRQMRRQAKKKKAKGRGFGGGFG
jgi:signal recognition particle subunit SRP54